jgi:S-adenosylmethionine uptake transporter
MSRPGSTLIPFAVATAGIALFSAMDAVMKGLSLAIGAYNALLWRTLAGALFGGAVFAIRRMAWPGRAAMRVHLLRGLLSVFMAILFFWGLARVPLAQGVALPSSRRSSPSISPPSFCTRRSAAARSWPPCSASPGSA